MKKVCWLKETNLFMQKNINKKNFGHKMEETFFEVGFEGTSNEDCLSISKIKSKSILVFDKKKIYGTTIKLLEDLKNDKMIKDIKVLKNNSKILFETNPKFYRPNEEIFNLINESDNSWFCDFVPINKHYLILENGNYYKIPSCKTDLVDIKYFTFKDRHLVNKFVKREISPDDLKNKLSDRCKQILLNGIIGNSSDHETMIGQFIQNFEDYPFIYPKHGSKDISELLSRINAVNGISYLLDPTLSVFEFKKFVCNPEEIKFTKSKNLRVLPIKTTVKCSKPIDSACNCEEIVDIFDRFNTNNDNDSEELVDPENDYTGQLYTNERNFPNDDINTSFMGCVDNKKISDDIIKLVETLNIKEAYPPPMFLQGKNSKIKIEDITTRNQVIDFLTSPSESLKSAESSLGFTYDNVLNYINDGYKYLIRSAHGNIFFKQIYKKELTGTKKYVRILNISYKILKERFFAWFYNGYEFIQILMLDSNSKCCRKDTYIIYLIKNERRVSNRDLEILNIHECDILTDISFQVWDYKHVLYL